MEIDKKGNIVIIKYIQGELNSFIVKLSNTLHDYEQKNIIIDLTLYSDLASEAILLFNDLSEKHKSFKKSFVLVVSSFDFDEIPDEMVVVPTIVEAHDIIEMEEIERDLGF